MASSQDASREARIAAIRQQIAADTYDSPERIEVAVEEILERYERGDLTAESGG